MDKPINSTYMSVVQWNPGIQTTHGHSQDQSGLIFQGGLNCETIL